MDGDVINILKRKTINLDSIANAIKSNINPRYVNVFVGGRVERAGIIQLSTNSTLIDAIDISEPRVLKGKINLIRYKNDGSVDTRVIKYNRRSARGSYSNPIIQDGDVIIVRKSFLNKSTEAISDITDPLRGLFNVYALRELLKD